MENISKSLTPPIKPPTAFYLWRTENYEKLKE